VTTTTRVDGPAAAAQAPELVVTSDEVPLRSVFARYGAVPLFTLATVNLIDNLDRAAFITLAPDIKRAFHLSQAAIDGINGVAAVLVVAGAVPFAVLADRGRRIRLAAIAAAIWSALTFCTGLVTSAAQLTLARIFSGLGQAAIEPVHGSLVADYYPVEARARAYGVHQSAQPLASILGPIIAGGVTSLVGGAAGWRWAFFVITPFGVVAAYRVARLREPRRGGMERERLAGRLAQEGLADAGETVRVPFATGTRRLLDIRTLRYLYLGIGVLGFGLVSGPVLISQYLQDHWGLGAYQRGAVFSLAGLGLMVGLIVGGVVGDRLFRHAPSWPLFLAGFGFATYSVVAAAALYLPMIVLVVAVLSVANFGIGVVVAPIRQIVAAASPPALRALSFALLGIFILLMGGFLGGIVFGAIADATSARTAMTVLAAPGLIAGALVAVGSRHVDRDIAMVADDVIEEARAAERRTSATGALLEVRNLDFSYGAVQVLFDVNLDVSAGEVVALLGTNGAGKSTFLRAVCGLEHPTRGSIRFDGVDITYLETEQILGLGIGQMPGGRAVFPGMTVAENLRAGAFAFRKDRERVQRDIAQVEEWFPILGRRRNQAAATLSGGEQQMLSLAKAFLTRPRLLCIDELSLGLAPAIVEQLFAIVREIHARGTTLLIVEQSVNVALALATTAVFMEKGEVRFTGPARELLDRPDLLRSVFLEGAAR
jgi:ABC-type branched-subunit amino acid transport system ATPase component/predicted MFS family arabinose efflux permease